MSKFNEVIVTNSGTQVQQVSAEMRMLEKAIEKGADFEVVEKLYDLVERNQQAQAKKAFHTAMSVFQSCVQMAHKSASASFRTKNGGQMGYSFASLDDVIKVARPALQKSGLSYTFKVKQEAGTVKKWNDSAKKFMDAATTIVSVMCTISHGDGHSESCSLTSPLEDSGQKNALQQIGSTVSYLKRYTLCSALGIATSDDLDDGHAYSVEDSAHEVVVIDYHAELDKIIKNRSEGNPNYHHRIFTHLSTKANRTVKSVKDLTSEEAEKAYRAMNKS